ncbi:MAG: hypothetical protein AVDCRST_MAG93-8722 [uncultured Chloroflexia bacterium]|uniref:N-acetyltransferase domain-containing protein n=1 Tax=uncultured Chloroflexia bacterium TaxID=1672391 RepID=A0A6J4N4G9_9CHLR|nr:MAG: hypothetical protein AVDCRST_MAG93-8722 [uncultured Chloroflexia bacterium]
MTLSDLNLLELHIDAAWTHDPDGRIRRVNEPDGGPAPRFYFGRTTEGNRWRFRHDVPPEAVHRLEQLAASESISYDLRAYPVNYEAFCDVLRLHGEVADTSFGPTYRFPADISWPANAVAITEANVELLGTLIPASDVHNVPRALPVRKPWIVVLEGGTGVASCFSSRLTARAAHAGLWTDGAFQGRGYGSDATAAWACAVREMGRIPLYGTEWENLASQGVARKLGLRMYASDLSLS